MAQPPSSVKALAVVVPVFDEADNVMPLLSEIHGALESKVPDYEVIFVDDGSRDDTLARLRAARAKFPRLRIVRHQRNCGQSTAIRSGVRAARLPIVATLDGDGQNDPADIPRLIAAAEAYSGSGSFPLVTGTRQRRRDSWIRRVSSRIANRVRSRLLKDDTPDTGCSLKLFSRDAYLELPYFDHMHRFLPALFRRQGAAVLFVDVNHRPRERGKSKYGVGNRLWVGIVDMLGVLWLQRRMKHPNSVNEDGTT